jgi:hypothetical protein
MSFPMCVATRPPATRTGSMQHGHIRRRHRGGETAAVDGYSRWRSGLAHRAWPPFEDDHRTGWIGLAGSHRLRPTSTDRNDDGPLQGADRTSATRPRLRRSADRGCDRRGDTEPDAGGRTSDICPQLSSDYEVSSGRGLSRLPSIECTNAKLVVDFPVEL